MSIDQTQPELPKTVKVPDTLHEGFENAPPTAAEKAVFDQSRAGLRDRDGLRKPEAQPTQPSTREKMSRGKKIGLAVTGALAGAGIITAAVLAGGAGATSNSPRGPEEGTGTDTAEGGTGTEVVDGNLDLQGQMEAAIQARPEQGTPEYDALFENIKLPDASVTDPATIIDAYATSVLIELPKLVIKDAPGGGADDAATDWVFEGDGRSIDALVEELHPEYFLDGAMDNLYGEDWDTNATNVDTANNIILPQIKRTASFILGDDIDNTGLRYETTDYGLQGATNDVILANPVGDIIYSDSSRQSATGWEKFIVRDGQWVATDHTK
jgi:hypothetical protein